MMGDNILPSIPGDVLGKVAHELPQALPTGPTVQRIMVRLPDGHLACVTFALRQSKRGRSTHWFWSPEHAELLPE